MVARARVGQRLGNVNVMSLLGLAVSLGISLPAEAQMQPSPMAMGHGVGNHKLADHSTEASGGLKASDDSMPTESNAATVPLTPAAHGDHFAVGFPQGWVVSQGETEPHLTAQSPEGTVPVTTEVSWYAEAPGQIVPTLLADIQEKGHTVARYDAIAVDGTTALRLWLTDLPEPDRPYAFITVVGYSDATAILVSHYETSSHELDNLLNQIHQSFQRGESAATNPHPHE